MIEQQHQIEDIYNTSQPLDLKPHSFLFYMIVQATIIPTLSSASACFNLAVTSLKK
jgi:hypothetical protein